MEKLKALAVSAVVIAVWVFLLLKSFERDKLETCFLAVGTFAVALFIVFCFLMLGKWLLG